MQIGFSVVCRKIYLVGRKWNGSFCCDNQMEEKSYDCSSFPSLRLHSHAKFSVCGITSSSVSQLKRGCKTSGSVLASNDAEQLLPKVVRWKRSTTTFPPTADDAKELCRNSLDLFSFHAEAITDEIKAQFHAMPQEYFNFANLKR